MKIAAFASAACFAVAVMAQGVPMPAGNIVPSIATSSRTLTQSLLSRLVSYFDMSHVSSAATSTPVIVSKVFDPASGKFTALAINVVQSGDAYHVPVCTTDSIVAAGSSAMASTDSCQYGVQLMPVPKNAARILAHIVRTAFRAIMSVSRPSFWLGGSSATDMPMMPQQQQQQQQ